VQKSLMPKGVDHCSACLTPRKTQVQKSLMPKGVDHQRLGRLGKGGKIVQKSLMPKGVDHPAIGVYDEEGNSCAKIFDAERR
jgi:hypothetical protein